MWTSGNKTNELLTVYLSKSQIYVRSTWINDFGSLELAVQKFYIVNGKECNVTCRQKEKLSIQLKDNTRLKLSINEIFDDQKVIELIVKIFSRKYDFNWEYG